MKKLLLMAVLAIAVAAKFVSAQVNGTAARPLVSTAEKPVYYYIENQSATAGYTGNVLLPKAATGTFLRHALKTTTNQDSALWQLVRESGTVKLKNKLTGNYMSVSHSWAASGDVFELSKYEGFTYYKMRSGRQSPTLAYLNNLCNRQTGEDSRLHWYFIVAPESQANYDELIATNPTSYFTDYGLYARTDNARKLNSLSFTAAQNTTLTINQQTVNNSSPVYFDKTTQVIEIVPGTNLSISFNWTGAWMRNIAYVDWNNDKIFSTADASERIGYNALAGSGTEMTKSITYTVPADQALGDYRMRIMVDWFDNHSSPNEGKFDLNYNGGSVVDVTLRVTNTPLPASPTLSFGTSNLIVKGDAFTLTPPAGATVKYTTDDTDPATSATAVTGTSVTATGNFKLRAISVKDGVNSTELVRDIKTLNVTLGNEYYIVFQRYNATLALQDMGDGVPMQTKTLSYGTATQLWSITKGSSDGLYKLTSQAGNVVYWSGSNFTVSAAPAVDAEVDMRFVISPNTTYTGYEIQRKSSTGNGMNPIGGSTVDKNIGEWTLGDGGNVVKFMTTKDMLLTSITTAQNILANTIDGTEFGQYTGAGRPALITAIAAAQAVYNDPSSVNDVTAKNAIDAAVTAYKATCNTNPASLLSATPGMYRWYWIRSTASHTYAAGKVISLGTRTVGEKYTYEPKVTDPKPNPVQLFRFELTDDKSKVANIVDGLGNVMAADGAIATTPTAGNEFALNLLSDGFSFNIKPTSVNAIHAQEAGSHIVNWAGDAGSASAWVFDFAMETTVKDATATNVAETQVYRINTTNRVVTVEGVTDFEVYSITGQKQNKERVLQSGVYFVKIGDFTQKVMVK